MRYLLPFYSFSLCLLFSFIIFLFPSQGKAYTPSLESLLRHANNPDIKSPWISTKIQIEESGQKDYFLAIDLFKGKSEGEYRIEEKIYGEDSMQASSLLSVKNGLPKGLEQRTFYALLRYLLLNKASGITQLLQENNSDFIPNKKMINNEKALLFKQQENYLKEGKKGTAPFTPLSPGEGRRVRQLLTSPYIDSKDQVLLEYNGNDVKLTANLSNTSLIFSNDTHRLESLTYKGKLPSINFELKEYLLFNAPYWLPKYLIIHTSQKRSFTLRFLSLEHKNMVPTPSPTKISQNISLPFLLQE